MIKKRFLIFGMLAVMLLQTIACKKDTSSPGQTVTAPAQGLIEYSLIKTMSVEDINKINTVELTKFLTDTSNPASNYLGRMSAAKNAVKLYRVTYYSTIPEQNRPTKATGLIAIPVTADTVMPMISYQHGTVFEKMTVPSEPKEAEEIEFMISQFASQGYILIAADYYGLGSISSEPNSYFVRYSTEQACLDLYKAAQEVLKKEQLKVSKFFINGWSQGAYNTMLFLRRLEQENITVNAAFTAAAPVDPQLFITRGLFNPRPIDAFYFAAGLSNMMYAIENYNGMSGLTKAYINPAYYDKTKAFFDFKLSTPEFFMQVPTQIDSVFTAQFFDDARKGAGPFWQKLAASEAYKWYSKTPIRAYYGLKDEAVPEYIATLAYEYMKKLGKQDITTHNAGSNADHRSTYIESVIDAKPWIDSFK